MLHNLWKLFLFRRFAFRTDAEKSVYHYIQLLGCVMSIRLVCSYAESIGWSCSVMLGPLHGATIERRGRVVKDFCFVFGRSRFQISARRLHILTEIIVVLLDPTRLIPGWYVKISHVCSVCFPIYRSLFILSFHAIQSELLRKGR
jgi:hypothetical protein